MKQAKRALALQPAPVPVRSLSARALNAVGWSYFAGFILLVAQVGYTAITARLVSPLAYGGYALALTIVGLAGLAGMVGIGDSVMRVPELTDRGARTALTLSHRIRGVVVGRTDRAFGADRVCASDPWHGADAADPRRAAAYDRCGRGLLWTAAARAALPGRLPYRSHVLTHRFCCRGSSHHLGDGRGRAGARAGGPRGGRDAGGIGLGPRFAAADIRPGHGAGVHRLLRTSGQPEPGALRDRQPAAVVRCPSGRWQGRRAVFPRLRARVAPRQPVHLRADGGSLPAVPGGTRQPRPYPAGADRSAHRYQRCQRDCLRGVRRVRAASRAYPARGTVVRSVGNSSDAVRVRGRQHLVFSTGVGGRGHALDADDLDHPGRFPRGAWPYRCSWHPGNSRRLRQRWLSLPRSHMYSCCSGSRGMACCGQRKSCAPTRCTPCSSSLSPSYHRLSPRR